ncbi:1-phosphofructokinase [Paludibacterium sp.]|uniref:1-phosphofructokinase n=1 Tax=Paludibacterium sp. TaxID=1917523 RepID=UPI0025EBC346|nr:1-phosphofructokinase [Paludibacterium sp.]
MYPIITVTLCPALDQTLHIDILRPGEVNEAENSHIAPGGKGINVASCLADWGLPVIATGVLGMENAAPFTSLFAAKGISNRFVLQEGATRSTIKLVDRANGQTTAINQPGLAIHPQAFEACLRQIDQLCAPGVLVVLSGRLPPGLPDTTYASLAARLMRQGARVALDCGGPALMHAVLATPPFCVKPNRHELSQAIGLPLPDIQDVLRAAIGWHRHGVEQVVVSLAAEGALFVVQGQAWMAQSPKVPVLGRVGAGDALLAGWFAAQHQKRGLEDAMRLALAFATGKLGRVGPHLPSLPAVRELARAVRLTRLPV